MAPNQHGSLIIGRISQLHCGAGCTLGDVVGEWSAFMLPSLAGKHYAVWGVDFVFAFAFGIIFQYYAVRSLLTALKADSLSLLAWQVGMYATMAPLQFVLFRRVFGMPAPVDSAEFWFAMQVAMIGGFITSFPMNGWLVRANIKHSM